MNRQTWTEERLNDLLTTPSDALVEDMKKIKGDIMVLGAGGKMGPTLCILAKNAIKKAGIDKRVIAVSRGSDPIAVELLKDNDVELIPMDLLDKEKLYSLPEVENVIYMAGKKFGTDGNEWQTWSMNSVLPAFVADKFKKSNIVVFSTGNVYPKTPICDGGCTESFPANPTGEYGMSCLARERSFEYAANAYGTNVLLYRLNYAIDLRYGVLYDIAEKILKDEPVSLAVPCVNFIWQGSANEIAIRGLLHASSPVFKLNVTGPEIHSVKKLAMELSKYLGKTPTFVDEPMQHVQLVDASLCSEMFGYPEVTAKELIRWQAEWILDGGRNLNKPTHFEVHDGKF